MKFFATADSIQDDAEEKSAMTQQISASSVQPFAVMGGNVLELFGIEKCPECKSSLNLTDNRPLKEFCEHVKCRSCLIKGTGDCLQCKESAVNGNPQQNGSAQPLRQYATRQSRKRQLQPETPTDTLPSTSASSFNGSNVSTIAAPSSTPSNLQNGSVLQAYHQYHHHQRQYTRKSSKRPSENPVTIQTSNYSDLATPSTSAASFTRNNVSLSHVNEAPQSNGQSAARSSTASLSDSLSDEEASEALEPKEKKRRNRVIIHDHISVINGDTTMFQCNVCMKKFKTKSHIKYHEFCQDGTTTKPFICGQCGQGFIAKSHYEYHLRTHTGERPYVCPKCGKGFNQQGKVTRHMRSHTGEKPFICTECGRGFANAQALRSHTLIHTGERPYACKFCNKGFTGMTNLKKHLITHTGERPYICTLCNKSFGLKWSLDLHLRTHSNERPYVCDQCERAFSNSKDLRRHLVIHSGERPFKCWICGSAFRRKDNLDRHIKNTHKQPKEVAKQLANEAAAEYHKVANANSPVPASKVNSEVISKVIQSAQFNAPPVSKTKKASISKKPGSKSEKKSSPKSLPRAEATISTAPREIITAPLNPRTEVVDADTKDTELYENVTESEDSFKGFASGAETEADPKIPEQLSNSTPNDFGISLFNISPSNMNGPCPNIFEMEEKLNVNTHVNSEVENKLDIDFHLNSEEKFEKEIHISSAKESDEKLETGLDLNHAEESDTKLETDLLVDLEEKMDINFLVESAEKLKIELHAKSPEVSEENMETELHAKSPEVSEEKMEIDILDSDEKLKTELYANSKEKLDTNLNVNQAEESGEKKVTELHVGSEEKLDTDLNVDQDEESGEKKVTELHVGSEEKLDTDLNVNQAEESGEKLETVSVEESDPDMLKTELNLKSGEKNDTDLHVDSTEELEEKLKEKLNTNSAEESNKNLQQSLSPEHNYKSSEEAYNEKESKETQTDHDEDGMESSKFPIVPFDRSISQEYVEPNLAPRSTSQEMPATAKTNMDETYEPEQVFFIPVQTGNSLFFSETNFEETKAESGTPFAIAYLVLDETTSEPQLFYIGTFENQIIQDYNTSTVALAPSALINSTETQDVSPSYQYAEDYNAPSHASQNQLPMDLQYSDEYTHTQQLSDNSDRSMLISRAPEVRSSLPETESTPECISPQPIYYDSHSQYEQYEQSQEGTQQQYADNPLNALARLADVASMTLHAEEDQDREKERYVEEEEASEGESLHRRAEKRIRFHLENERKQREERANQH